MVKAGQKFWWPTFICKDYIIRKESNFSQNCHTCLQHQKEERKKKKKIDDLPVEAKRWPDES